MLQEKFKKYKKLKAELSEFIDSIDKEDLVSEVKCRMLAIMEKFPNIYSFYVRGFTPSFNDGEPCIHRHYSNFECDGELGEEDGKMIAEIDDLQDILEDCLGTNWEFLCERDEDDVIFNFDDDYYCDY